MHRAGSITPPLCPLLVDRLMVPEAFDHPVTSVERIETHISWVILTDAFAYKIKKPLVLDFLDFGSLDRRRHFCEEELRLNRPWASDIYLAVVPITDDGGQARFGGDGPPVDYAVKMRRFDTDMRLDRQLTLGLLTVGDMRALGNAVATRHLDAQPADAAFRERTLHMTTRQMHDNFFALENHVSSEQLSSLSAWTQSEIDTLEKMIAARFDDGFFRDCHGDLHLANLVRMPDGIRTFDCIEFNDDLRRIDVVCDIAFLVMDLVSKGRRDLAAHFLNRYLERTGDYEGVVFMDLYFVYRCLVRAKVAVLSSHESRLENERLRNIADADRYCRIALRQTWKPAPVLIIMRGMSGSGKTWISGQVMAALPAIRLRSDIERKRLFGFSEAADTHSKISAGIYDPASSRDVYQHLVRTAGEILGARHNVILDAAFLRTDERDLAFEMADGCGCAVIIVDVRAPLALMQQRLRQRRKDAVDASEAGLEVLEHQRSTAEALTAREIQCTVVHDNVDGSDVARLIEIIASRAIDPSGRPIGGNC
ncbi:MAG: AAA family ATPase [Woeseiaceae bacterium]|nr:AAA family ATPase [Woeseiaceae bacterium]